MEIQKFDDLPNVPDDEDEVPEQERPELEEARSLRKYKVPTYPMFIGRDKKLAICVPVPAVSRQHAKVFEKQGVYYLQDLGSINGTFLNDRRILDPVALNDGDRIKIGITKQFPRGVREYVFHLKVGSKEQDELSERDSLLREAGVGRTAATNKVLLRHCIFKISRSGVVSVLISGGSRRVALDKLHMGHRVLNFQSLTPYKVKDTLNFSIENSKLPESIQLTIKINKIEEVGNLKVHLHSAEILKISDRHKSVFEKSIEESKLICYVTSQLKE